MTDEQIIQNIKKGGKDREAAVSYLYQTNKRLLNVGRFIQHIKDRDKREEAFNDALLDAVKKIEEGVFRADSKINTFLARIFRFKCIDAFRKITRDKIIFSEIDPEIQGIILPKFSFERTETLEYIFENCEKKQKKKMCRTCKTVLYDWANGYSMKEIATRNKIPNEKAAKVKKMRCMKIMRGL